MLALGSISGAPISSVPLIIVGSGGGAGGGGGGGGAMGWDGKIYPLERPRQNRVYFDESQARPAAQEVINKAALDGFSPELYEEAIGTIDGLQQEILALQGMAAEIKEAGGRAEKRRVAAEIKLIQEQIEEIDTVFVIFAIAAQIH